MFTTKIKFSVIRNFSKSLYIYDYQNVMSVHATDQFKPIISPKLRSELCGLGMGGQN